MKRIAVSVFVLVLLVFTFCNASIHLKDSEGWFIIQCGWTLSPHQVLIQSHDGYILGDRVYTEHICTIYKTEFEEHSVEIKNPTGREISVKLTYGNARSRWIKIAANDCYIITVETFEQ